MERKANNKSNDKKERTWMSGGKKKENMSMRKQIGRRQAKDRLEKGKEKRREMRKNTKLSKWKLGGLEVCRGKTRK